MTFTRNNDGFGAGSLMAVLDGVDLAGVQRVFGAPDTGAYVDTDAGYDGDEYGFVTPDGRVVNLYFRWNVARLGGVDESLLTPFVEFLKANGFPTVKVSTY